MTIMVLPRAMCDRKPLSAERLPPSGPGNGGGGKSGAGGSYATSDEAVGTAKAPVSGHTSVPANTVRSTPAERKTLPLELKPPGGKQPETLVGFLKRMGCVKDTDGWLSQMGVDN
ncbi:MAG: hypothetical protein FD176_2695 [Rhodospirillaceae bacterium]|nr:MAG: hypothetical protein FD176_2695 [Rhodospirillaceae bacterium]TNC98207.1 MAG: hypothetical protein FD119_349 [Stygiobacter sp.]